MKLAAVLVIAQQVFGPVPCGTPVVERAKFTDPGTLAGADPATCRIFLNRRWASQMPPAMKCTLVLHEYGHLAGREHSDNPNSVMYPDYLRDDRRCLSKAPPAWGTSGTGPSSP